MKAVMISIKPEWCKLIADGKKTVEVRKTRPKLETPFKCYIYCTYGFGLIEYKDEVLPNHLLSQKVSANKKWDNCCNGKVIGEFVCDEISEIGFTPYNHGDYLFKDENTYKSSCLSLAELDDYLQSRFGYAWHISDLVIYDEPKELYNFCRPCDKNCDKCNYLDVQEIGNSEHTKVFKTCLNRITRPPQSWCYVEELI